MPAGARPPFGSYYRQFSPSCTYICTRTRLSKLPVSWWGNTGTHCSMGWANHDQIQHHYRYNPQIHRHFSPNQSECGIYGITAKHVAGRPWLVHSAAPLRPSSERDITAKHVSAEIWNCRPTPRKHTACAPPPSRLKPYSPALTHQARASSLALPATWPAAEMGGGWVACGRDAHARLARSGCCCACHPRLCARRVSFAMHPFGRRHADDACMCSAGRIDAASPLITWPHLRPTSFALAVASS